MITPSKRLLEGALTSANLGEPTLVALAHSLFMREESTKVLILQIKGLSHHLHLLYLGVPSKIPQRCHNFCCITDKTHLQKRRECNCCTAIQAQIEVSLLSFQSSKRFSVNNRCRWQAREEASLTILITAALIRTSSCLFTPRNSSCNFSS